MPDVNFHRGSIRSQIRRKHDGMRVKFPLAADSTMSQSKQPSAGTSNTSQWCCHYTILNWCSKSRYYSTIIKVAPLKNGNCTEKKNGRARTQTAGGGSFHLAHFNLPKSGSGSSTITGDLLVYILYCTLSTALQVFFCDDDVCWNLLLFESWAGRPTTWPLMEHSFTATV